MFNFLLVRRCSSEQFKYEFRNGITVWVEKHILRIRVLFVCFFRFVSKLICLFRLFRYGFETPIFFGFAKQTENQPKQIEFRFVSVLNENLVCLFRGHTSFYVAFFRFFG
jgi:hypothetical protein